MPAHEETPINGWSRAEEHVRSELRRLSEGQDLMLEHIIQIKEVVAGLKVKASIWGAIAGILAAIGFKVMS
jgi:hypothetical protein